MKGARKQNRKRLPRRKRLPAAERRESIVELARHAFAARGYDGVRTQDLASAAGVSEALIYQHFSSKRDLYREVVNRSCEALHEQLDDAIADVEPSERLERGLTAFVAFVADRSSGWSLLVSRLSDEEILPYQRKAHQECIGELTELFLEQAGTRSAKARRQLEQLAEAIGGGAEALANWWSDHPKARREEGMTMLVDFTRQGLDSVAASSASSGQGAKRRSRAG